MAGGTDLFAPLEPGFQSWLQRVPLPARARARRWYTSPGQCGLENIKFHWSRARRPYFKSSLSAGRAVRLSPGLGRSCFPKISPSTIRPSMYVAAKRPNHTALIQTIVVASLVQQLSFNYVFEADTRQVPKLIAVVVQAHVKEAVGR